MCDNHAQTPTLHQTTYISKFDSLFYVTNNKIKKRQIMV